MSLDAPVAAALGRIQNPRLGNDLLSAGMIRDLTVSADGRVAFTFLLSRQDPATLVREARKALQAIDGRHRREDQGARSRGTGSGDPRPARRSAGTAVRGRGSPRAVPGRHAGAGSGHRDLLGQGRGREEHRRRRTSPSRWPWTDHRVGLMDADIYGPNIPRMFGLFERPPVVQGRIQPLQAHGVKLISLGFIIERDAPAIWRGPIIMKVIQQFLRDVDWGELDYFIVDLPPGTGDAQLSLVQSVAVSGAVIVTTPQEVAVGDALRGAKMFERVNVPVYGVVENMSGFTDPGDRAPLGLLWQRRRPAPGRRAGRAAAGPGAAAARHGRAGRPGPAHPHRRPEQPGGSRASGYRRAGEAGGCGPEPESSNSGVACGSRGLEVSTEAPLSPRDLETLAQPRDRWPAKQ